MIDINILDLEFKDIKQIVESTLMNYDYNYKIHNNNDISDNYKIYIIECNKISDIEIIKGIREHDWQSMIICTTKNNNIIKDIYYSELLIMSVINKNTDYKQKLQTSLINILNNYNKHPMTLNYSYKGIEYIINYQDIIYIEKIKNSKNSIIKTQNQNYYIPQSISEIITKLDNSFIKCSRSFIVNLKQVKSYNKKNNLMMLKNDEIISEISRNMKSKIINYYRGIE